MNKPCHHLIKLTLERLTFLSAALCTASLHAALLAYEPFTNASGSAIINSTGGLGYANAWQNNSSSGVATNTSYGLSYTDTLGHQLVTAGGAGFFQGLSAVNSSMQPFRQLNFTRGTNVDGANTWISFIIVRSGPTTTAANPYARGANLDYDFTAGNATTTTYTQKLAVGGSSGAAANTVSLIPQGSGTNLKPSTNQFGGATNFVVVKIEHVANAFDNAYLFVNPTLDVEPSNNSAATNSLAGFDYSFDRVRIFAGGNSSATQPYAEITVDEYRIGESFADVTPYTTGATSTTAKSLIITNAAFIHNGIILSGFGGSNGAPCLLHGGTDLSVPYTNWPVIASNSFDASGNFTITDPAAVEPTKYFLVRQGEIPPAPVFPPSITTQPADVTVAVGQNASFYASATGTAPLVYRWRYNTNTVIASATNSSLTISNAQQANAGTYSIVITNSVGAVTSVYATLTVTNPPGTPIITAQPTSLTVTEGSNATFTVSANGTGLLYYQWFFNTNTTLTDATNASLSLSNVTLGNGGGYSVRVSNTAGIVYSSTATLTVNPVLLAGAFYVATNGNDANAGSLAAPYKTIAKGLTKVTTGGVVYVRAGTYALSSKLSLSGAGSGPNNMIRLWAYPGESPTIDSTGNTSDGIGISGRYYHLKGLTVMNAGHNGINISGHSNIVEFCTVHDNGNTGLHITGSTSYPSNNLILNCDAYLNYDPPVGGNADGFSAKWEVGPGNVFRGCRAWWNSDDGWDLWMCSSPIVIDQCWAFYNGTNYWSEPLFNGNGQGFKLGGNYVGTQHHLTRSVTFRNMANGVDQNNNEDSQTVDNNVGWANVARNFNLNHGTNSNPHVVRNNLSFAGGSSDSFRSGTIFSNNSWQVISAPAANASDVLSVDESVAQSPRNADGSLPYWPFLRPVPGGRLIDKGIDVGLPYSGMSPDLGAFESP